MNKSKKRKTNFVFKRILSVFMLSLLIFLSYPATAKAASTNYKFYSFDNSGSYSSINVSKTTLKAAKKTASKIKEAFSQKGKIEVPQQTHIYHFEAPKSGYYAFYTTGKLDTAIKVYEEQGLLGLGGFKYRDFNDDGSKADTNRTNACVVVELDKGEDYYVCVRAYHNDTGEYILKVEPNEDKLLYSRHKYTTWKRTSDLEGYPSIATSSMLYKGIASKQYFTKADVVVFYWALDPSSQRSIGLTRDYVYSAYNENVSKAISELNNALGVLPLDDLVAPGAGISVAVLGAIFNYLYDKTEFDEYDMMEYLAYECGVYHDTKTHKWSVKSGLMIQEDVVKNIITVSSYSYKKYNNNMYYGVKYEKGNWIK